MSEMMKVVLESREEKGKGACKKLRPAGYTPCVFYGPQYPEAVRAKVKTAQIAKVVQSGRWETHAMTLSLPGGKEEMGLMREVQKDSITDKILHIDFLQLVKGHKITVNVPVELEGRDVCIGAKQGGVIDLLLREIPVEVLPSQIPSSFVVDVSNMDLGDLTLVKDIPLSDGIDLLVDPDEVVVSVVVPRIVVEEEAEEEEEQEVEVVSKGKEEDHKEEEE